MCSRHAAGGRDWGGARRGMGGPLAVRQNTMDALLLFRKFKAGDRSPNPAVFSAKQLKKLVNQQIKNDFVY